MAIDALFDLVLPRGVRPFLEEVTVWPLPVPTLPFRVEPCPEDMALVERTCVDVLPYPNNPDEEPLLGVSAIPEAYLDEEESWDCKTLCEAQDKRICTWAEWQAACEGTPREKCGPRRFWLDPNWARVMRRNPDELRRLDQHAKAADYPECVSKHGVRMMTTVEEWVAVDEGYAFSRGFWSRDGACEDLNWSHAANWHGYSNACRCCRDADL